MCVRGLCLHRASWINRIKGEIGWALLTVFHSNPIVFHSCTRARMALGSHVVVCNWARPDRRPRQPYPLVQVESRRVKLQERKQTVRLKNEFSWLFPFLWSVSFVFCLLTRLWLFFFSLSLFILKQKLINVVRFVYKRHWSAHAVRVHVRSASGCASVQCSAHGVSDSNLNETM